MTQYERGTKLERDLQHRWEYHGYYVMRSAGSHGLADLIHVGKGYVWLIQCKLHDKLRDKEREEELMKIERPYNVIPCTAWYEKRGRRKYIVTRQLDSGQELEIEPLNREEEKKYQEMKKAKIEARKSAKSGNVLPSVQQNKTSKRSKL